MAHESQPIRCYTDAMASDTQLMEAAARRRDPAWDSDPPLNRSLYYEGWTDARNHYEQRVHELEEQVSWTTHRCNAAMGDGFNGTPNSSVAAVCDAVIAARERPPIAKLCGMSVFTGMEPISLVDLSDFKVERTFEFEDKDFAHRIMVLPSYTVQFTPMNITAMTWPGHE